jgi:hypothetical protein
MIGLDRVRHHQPLLHVHTWALERLIAAQLNAGDLRWMLIALALRWAGAAISMARRQIALLAAGGASAACEGC